MCDFGNTPAYGAKSNDAKSSPPELKGTRSSLRTHLPLAGPELGIKGGKLAAMGKHCGEYIFRYRIGIDARRVRDRNAMRCGPVYRDEIEADPLTNNAAQGEWPFK